MKLMTSIFAILAVCLAGFSTALAAETGSFLSVQGSAQLNGSGAQAGATVKSGDEVVTGKDGLAVLKFFDGSEITLKPGSDLKVDRLEAPSPADKVLGFKLMLGQLLAKVKKLVSAKSSFEIDAGGVVCGVRGTEFSMDYDSAKEQLKLQVISGTVGAKAQGQETLFNAGETALFIHGEARDPQSGLPTGKRQHEPFHMEGSLSLDPALMDLKAFYGGELLINHDNVFTDPAVGGTARIPVGAVVPPGEAVP